MLKKNLKLKYSSKGTASFTQHSNICWSKPKILTRINQSIYDRKPKIEFLKNFCNGNALNIVLQKLQKFVAYNLSVNEIYMSDGIVCDHIPWTDLPWTYLAIYKRGLEFIVIPILNHE